MLNLFFIEFSLINKMNAVYNKVAMNDFHFLFAFYDEFNNVAVVIKTIIGFERTLIKHAVLNKLIDRKHYVM